MDKYKELLYIFRAMDVHTRHDFYINSQGLIQISISCKGFELNVHTSDGISMFRQLGSCSHSSHQLKAK